MKSYLYFIIAFVAVWLAASVINIAFATGTHRAPQHNSHSKATSSAKAKSIAKGGSARQGQDQQQATNTEVSTYEYSDYKEAAASAFVSVASKCHAGAAGQGRGIGLSVTTRAEFCDHVDLAGLKLSLANGKVCESPVDVVSKGQAEVESTVSYCWRERESLYQQVFVHIADAEAAAKRKGFLKRAWQVVW